ncbi:MAG: rhodanese-related sulfurtransferase [Bacteroidetes bacterium]|nr:rhodanese-related sulfurtransferase [Bacteroidota bacterium]
MLLQNRVNKKELKKRIQEESIKRITVSFYRYVIINNPQEVRDNLFLQWNALKIMGRIYIAHEGINAQMCVPEENWEIFKYNLNQDPLFAGMPFKIAIEDDGKSFYKLTIKVRAKIVADGLDDEAFDVTNVGTHLTAKEFNQAMEDSDTIIVDMRNHYESEVGKFTGAICPDADTFREELPMVIEELKDKKDKKIIMYCTGGVRCEKASAYLKHHGFKDVSQLHGGVIDYVRQIKAEGIESKFIGKNFVFDERVGERITDDVIAHCHQCGSSCDTHVNCANDDCHLLFIQCEACAEKMNGCCTPECMQISSLSVEEQKALRKGRKKENSLSVYKSRLRPNLKDVLEGFNLKKENP